MTTCSSSPFVLGSAVFLLSLRLLVGGIAVAQDSFLFQDHGLRRYELVNLPQTSGAAVPTLGPPPSPLLPATREGSTNRVHFTRDILLQTAAGTSIEEFLDSARSSLLVARKLEPNLAILRAMDPLAAARESERLSKFPNVDVCRPVLHRPLGRHFAYAQAPNDLYFPQQWYLENREAQTGAPKGVDINIRSAWTVSRGSGVTVALGDDGVDFGHADLAPQSATAFHFNFINLNGDGSPLHFDANHGTAVAGILAAAGKNQIGISGAAPDSKLASWVIFDQNGFPASEERLMDMFQYQSNRVSIQNHSWGNPNRTQLDVGPLILHGISNAVTRGRQGLGVIIVRSAGNNRRDAGNVNDDAYANHPLVVAVGAVRSDGRAARYSNPGACMLVAAPSAESNESDAAVDLSFPSMFTTDRVGPSGFNPFGTDSHPELADYGFDATGFSGTSASAPQISGIAALMLSANPRLGFRDVQQIFILASRQSYPQDPDIERNQAGLRFSHNTGFGVPDAGYAVRLALAWSNRPPFALVSVSITNAIPIPDDGLRVVVQGANVPTNLNSIPAFPSLGLHADAPTPLMPVVDVGLATGPINTNLQGKGALITRSPASIALFEPAIHSFSNKIERAAAAGAVMAIIQNDRDSRERVIMDDTDFAPIPAVFIDQNSGDALGLLLKQHPATLVGIATTPAQYRFTVSDSILVEHVGLQITTTHRLRSDLRITLVSPSGTRSVLQRKGLGSSSGFATWTYYSVKHHFERSRGEWVLEVTDENPTRTGSLANATLFMSGVRIDDTDGDGLDDHWEKARLGSLSFRSDEDPDLDGYSNMLEQLLGSDPSRNEDGLGFTLSIWSEGMFRLSWVGRPGRSHLIRGASKLGQPFKLLGQTDGILPETEFFFPSKESTYFFELAP